MVGCSILEESVDDLDFRDRDEKTESSLIESAYVRWLDLRKKGSTSTLGDDAFVVRNPSPRLEHLPYGWRGDRATRTVGADFVYLDAKGNPRRVTLIGGPKGETALVASHLGGAVDVPVIVTRDPEGRIRVPHQVIDPDLEAEAECVEKAAKANDFEAVLACLGLLDPSGGGGGGGEGGLFDAGFVGLGEPDCSDGNIVTKPDSPGWRVPLPSPQRTQDSFTMANRRPDELGFDPTDEYNAAAQKLIDAISAYNLADVEANSNPEDPAAQQRRVQAARDFYKAEAEYLQAEQEASQSQPGSEPVPGDPSAPVDPRCEQRETDSERGSLFSNGDFCKSGDFLTCLAEEQDSIRKITDGKCATVESPVGGTMLRCNDEGGDPLEVSPQGEEVYPPDDPLEWTDPTSPPTHRGKIQTRFADTFDLGHVLIGLCAAGGCPSDPRTP